MKITTWNVNGYRSILTKGLGDWVQQEAPDVLCLQEIKVHPEQLAEEQRSLPGYTPLWNPAERRGYSGVATFHRVPVDGQRFGVGEARFDAEGRVICTRVDGVLLFNVYFPSGQRGHDRVGFKLEFYARLLELCDELHAQGEQIILTGDFNTAHREIDLANPRQNARTSGFLPEEREWVSRYLEHGFADAFRRLYPERVAYTWWTYVTNARARNVGWRLDYFLVSEGLLPRVKDVVIHAEVMGSDHCPVSLHLHPAGE